MKSRELLKLAAARLVMQKKATPWAMAAMMLAPMLQNVITSAQEKNDPAYRLNRLDLFGRALSRFQNNGFFGEDFTNQFANSALPNLTGDPNIAAQSTPRNAFNLSDHLPARPWVTGNE